jgi:hypothetical protein
MRASLSDETWVPLKWIWTIIGSCAITVVTIVSGIWYIAALVAREDVASAEIVQHSKRIDALEEQKEAELTYWRSVDGRLSRIEGYLSAQRRGR